MECMCAVEVIRIKISNWQNKRRVGSRIMWTGCRSTSKHREGRNGGDGSGEIKRVENFFWSSSPLPATPGITCPVLNITRVAAGEKEQDKGNLQKKQDALSINCLHTEVAWNSYFAPIYNGGNIPLEAEPASIAEPSSFVRIWRRHFEKGGWEEAFQNYCQNSQRWETDKEVCCLSLLVLALSAKVLLSQEVEL